MEFAVIMWQARGRVPVPEVSDGALVRAVADGDQSALAVLYDRHGAALLAYVTRLTGDAALAEEVVQDTLLGLWRGAGRFRGDSAVRTWLFAIARRQAAGRGTRDAGVSDEVLAIRASASPGPEAVVLARARAAEVRDALDRLSPVHREVLHLVLVQGLSLRRTAAVTGVPVGTVKSRLNHARRSLAALVSATEGSER